MAFIYPVTQIVSLLVMEKSNKLREGLQMMGASKLSYSEKKKKNNIF